MLSQTAIKAIDAYGGAELWKKSKFIEAEISVKGALFTLKRRAHFERALIKMEIHRSFSKITPIGKNKVISGVLDGNKVYLENAEGEKISERENPRDFFPYYRRLFYWDDLDMAYFANYATWNYFTLPALLMNETIVWNEIESGFLEGIFPNNFPTHSKKQTFKFDKESGKLLQHNYTAEVVSGLATAANVVLEHKEQNGIIFPSRRIITPQSKNGGAMKMPVLVDITVHNFNLT